jgi:hypothetical protein
MGIVERAGMVGVLGTLGGLDTPFYGARCGGVKYGWKIFISNFSIRNKFIIFLLYGL